MIKHNFVGAFICFLIFVGCFFWGESGTVVFYLNIVSLLVVVSGTLGAVFLSHPFNRLSSAFKVAKNVYTKDVISNSDEVVNLLLDMAVRSKYDGILSLERYEKQLTVSFLRDALAMVVDGYSEEEIKDILGTEMHFFRLRRQQSERVFRTMAAVAPPFGVAGSIIGLIGMLVGMGDTGIILKTIPLALTSTLYSIIISYFILIPIAEGIYSKTQRELYLQSIISEGVVEIAREKNVYKLERKLSTFLTPSQREGAGQGIRQIQKRYADMKKGKGAPREQRAADSAAKAK
ncbi:MAG TPA: MotA/TolQ/ExbB proton channel family protein [Syntrophorhabdaceae bacterium]|jgi:chemotaxis protein MotA